MGLKNTLPALWSCSSQLAKTNWCISLLRFGCQARRARVTCPYTILTTVTRDLTSRTLPCKRTFTPGDKYCRLFGFQSKFQIINEGQRYDEKNVKDFELCATKAVLKAEVNINKLCLVGCFRLQLLCISLAQTL